jgi:uncharacterized protein YprB with RNaseH-like and TPR domain
MIFDPRVRNDLTLEQHDGPRIIADARLRTSSGDVLFEMKSHKVIYESHVSAMVEKYGSAKSWMDDKDILRKVVILNTQNGGLEKYRAMCEEAGWIVVDGDQFTRLMKQSVDLLLHREPDLFYRSSIPLQDPETTLMSITNEVYREAHVLMPITRREERKWWRKLYRRTITDLQSGNRVDQRERFDRHEEQAFDFVNAWNSHLYDGKEQITLDEDVVLLDIETSGFKRMDSQIIVIGLAYMKEGEMVTHTIHVRDPHEERAALEDFYSTIGRFEKIVTFNGKSFDLPFLHYRSAVHRIKPDFRSEHIDLLPIYRKYTGNAKGNKLQKYELRNLGVVRKGDIHGRAIGEAYQRFIQGEANHRMQDVLNHNRFDLISTAIMYHRLVENEGKLLF